MIKYLPQVKRTPKKNRNGNRLEEVENPILNVTSYMEIAVSHFCWSVIILHLIFFVTYTNYPLQLALNMMYTLLAALQSFPKTSTNHTSKIHVTSRWMYSRDGFTSCSQIFLIVTDCDVCCFQTWDTYVSNCCLSH
jgi:hypothetical protein